MSAPQGECPSCKTANAYTSVICNLCGARLPWADAVTAKAAASSTPKVSAPSMKKAFLSTGSPSIWARCLIYVGLAWVAYFLLFFDTSVQVGGFGRINNIGLISQRQSFIMVGIGIVIVGVMIYFFTKPKTD
jgi:hypothetical protein